MKEIPLTQGKVAIVDDADYELVKPYKWYAMYHGKRWYALSHQVNKVKNGPTLMHRFIMGYPSSDIDHINLDGLDNTRLNLRLCNSSENGINRGLFKNNASGFKGVRFTDRGWRATLRVMQKHIHLGYYDGPEGAAAAYDQAALLYFGEFALTNAMMGLL